MRNRWSSAQCAEVKCWKNVQKKIVTKNYIEKKKNYWKSIFKKIKSVVEIDEKKNFLDFGCGPSGIVLIYPNKKNLTCIDPLIEEYLNLNPFLKSYKASFETSKIEDFKKRGFDYIFGFNSLDHTDSIKKSLNSIYKSLKNGGLLTISVNCHNFDFMQKIILKTSFIFDKPHPHQYLLKHYLSFLKNANFEILKLINIDNEISYMNEPLQKTKEKFSLKSLVKGLFHPFILVNLIGIKTFGKEKKKTIYSTYIIIAKK
jgi:SAM-dependent methyltransferase